MLTRRRTLIGASTALALIGTRYTASELTLGSSTLTTVSDGKLRLPSSFALEGVPENQKQTILDQFHLNQETIEPECNLALYRDQENTVLFDVGSGPDFMPTAGIIQDSLDAIDITPEDITHVVFTHAHPDHIWGLLDDFDEPLFSNAQYFIGRNEWDYWWNPETVNTIGDARAVFAVGAKRRLEAIEGNVNFFDDGDTLLPNITAIKTYGHTPGHMAFEVAGKALIVGDAIGNHHIAFHHPEWLSGSDQNQIQAIQSRKMLLDRLASEQLPLVGFHLPNGGMGYVERHKNAFRFIGGA